MNRATADFGAANGRPGSSLRAWVGALAIAAAGVLNVVAPAPVRAATEGLPACAYAEVTTDRASYDDWQTTLLDQTYRLPRSYAPPDLVPTRIAGGGQVRRFVVTDLRAMSRAARAAGAGIRVESAYRSFSDQIWTFGHWVAVMPARQALLSSARRGHSEHQLGTALDFASLGGSEPWFGGDWAKTRAGAWMKAHAWEYGFVESYPRGKSPSVTCYVYEPWHFRYFGRAIARAIHDSGLTSREWLWQQFRQSPTDVTVTRGNGSATVSWRAPVGDGGSAITGFIAISTPEGRSCTTTGALSCEITGLSNGYPYAFRVRALHANGEGPPSAGSASVVPRAGSTFFALTPSRVLNGYVARSGATFSFQVEGLSAGDERRNVPPDATAVTGVLSVSGATAGGWVALTPDPGEASTAPTLSFPADDARATGVTVPLGGGGRLSVTFGGAVPAGVVCVSFDVTGYFRDGLSGATYVPLTPNRIADSGRNRGLGRLDEGVPATFQVTGQTLRDGATNVPPYAIAVTGTLTVARQTAGGYLALGPEEQSSPGTASLYFPKGEARATDLTVGLGDGGSLSVTFVSSVAGATAGVAFDVTGYFLPGSGGATYVPLTPHTLIDSRVKLHTAATQRAATFTVVGSDPLDKSGRLPLGATAVTGWFAITGQPPGRLLTLTRATDGRPAPPGLSFPVGTTRAIGVTVPLGPSGRLDLGYGGGRRGLVHVVFEVTGYFVR